MQDIKFHTTLGQAVYDSIFLPAKVSVSANFLPRRMAFAYELGDEEWDGSGIPTTLRRSREDCPKVCSSFLWWFHAFAKAAPSNQSLQHSSVVMQSLGHDGQALTIMPDLALHSTAFYRQAIIVWWA